MIVGTGVDLLSLVRLRALVARRNVNRFAKRVLSAQELEEWHVRRLESERPWSAEQELRFLAVRYVLFICHLFLVQAMVLEADLNHRWASKEAAYKALYPTYKLGWKQISVEKVGGKPSLQLHEVHPAKVNLEDNTPPGKLSLLLSVSHDADLVVAFVVASQTKSKKPRQATFSPSP